MVAYYLHCLRNCLGVLLDRGWLSYFRILCGGFVSQNGKHFQLERMLSSFVSHYRAACAKHPAPSLTGLGCHLIVPLPTEAELRPKAPSRFMLCHTGLQLSLSMPGAESLQRPLLASQDSENRGKKTVLWVLPC